MSMIDSDIIVRINGVLPEISEIGSPDFSKRAAEILRKDVKVNTSCSLFACKNQTQNSDSYFHLLIDVGTGVVESLERGHSQVYKDNTEYDTSGHIIGNSTEQMKKSGPPIGSLSSISSQSVNTENGHSSTAYPDVLFLTHSHDDHIRELPKLLEHFDASRPLNVYCTKSCYDQLQKKFPQLFEADRNKTAMPTTNKTKSDKRHVVNLVDPDLIYEIGPFSVVPILAFHGDDSEGCVIYAIKFIHHGRERKIVIGWDFLEIYTSDKNILWNPDLLILGTQSYNPHPETGMISVSDAFRLIKEWNARECYIVHYRGLLDTKEAQNQWFRGPINPMTTEELQQIIDTNLKIISPDGSFMIKVADEGMLWKPRENDAEKEVISNSIEIEGLDNYVLKIDNDYESNMIKLVIEDKINRYDLRFMRPHLDFNNKNIFYAAGEKGMLAKGPELRMEIIPGD
jgi:phosphoribosyl 1,2-cyclic phosphodiesterase